MNFIDEFRVALAKDGLQYNGEIIADSQIHRFHIEGDSIGSKNGWYVLFGGDAPAGVFGSWKEGFTVKWRTKDTNIISLADQRKYYEWVVKKKNQLAFEQTQKHELTKRIAQRIWKNASECKVHPYLTLKCVQSCGLKITSNNTLLIPCFNASNEIVNLERIFLDICGQFQKRPLKGGQRTGAFFLIGKVNPIETIYLGEGYATMASVFESTGSPSVLSFNAGNLVAVATLIREMYPNANLVLVADKDENGIGERYAKEASSRAAGFYVVPDFSIIPSNLKPEIKRSDFNDLFVLHLEKQFSRSDALAEVRRQLENNAIKGLNYVNTK